MTENRGDLGEQALSKLAEMTLANQLDEVEKLDVDIKTDPLKVIQGKVDSANISGEGMVMQNDLRMEKIELETSSIAINPLSVPFGKIELTHPTEATGEVILTEADINHAFNSDFIRKKLQGFKVAIEGELVTVETKEIEFKLPGNGRFFLQADLVLQPSGETKKIAFTAIPKVSPNKKTIILEDILYSDGGNFSPDFSKALLDLASNLLDLDNFNLKSIQLRIRDLKLETQKMIIMAEADIESLPSAS